MDQYKSYVQFIIEKLEFNGVPKVEPFKCGLQIPSHCVPHM